MHQDWLTGDRSNFLGRCTPIRALILMKLEQLALYALQEVLPWICHVRMDILVSFLLAEKQEHKIKYISSYHITTITYHNHIESNVMQPHFWSNSLFKSRVKQLALCPPCFQYSSTQHRSERCQVADHMTSFWPWILKSKADMLDLFIYESSYTYI